MKDELQIERAHELLELACDVLDLPEDELAQIYCCAHVVRWVLGYAEPTIFSEILDRLEIKLFGLPLELPQGRVQ